MQLLPLTLLLAALTAAPSTHALSVQRGDAAAVRALQARVDAAGLGAKNVEFAQRSLFPKPKSTAGAAFSSAFSFAFHFPASASAASSSSTPTPTTSSSSTTTTSSTSASTSTTSTTTTATTTTTTTTTAKPKPTGTGAQINGTLESCTKPGCLALTFDDGPWIYHNDISDRFAKEGAKTTFFVNGNNYACIYDEDNVQALARSLKQGHQIGSHTWGHVHLLELTYPQIDKQIELVEEALLKTQGIVPAFLRPPFGETNDTITKYLNDKHGLVVVNWSDSTEDANGETVEYGLEVLRSIKAPKKAIVLQHEVVQETNDTVVSQEFDILRKNGYNTKTGFNTVAQSLGAKPYKIQTTPQKRDATWTCEGKPAPGAAE